MKAYLRFLGAALVQLRWVVVSCTTELNAHVGHVQRLFWANAIALLRPECRQFVKLLKPAPLPPRVVPSDASGWMHESDGHPSKGSRLTCVRCRQLQVGLC